MNLTNRELTVSDDSEVRLTLTVAGASIRETYDKLVSDLRRNARIKGFRRGKVPREVLIRKYGSVLLVQTTEQVVNESMRQAVDEVEQKPLPFAQPTLDGDPQVVLGEDFTFTVTYDTKPRIELGEYRGVALRRPQVTITDADLEPELRRLQEQNAEVLDKPADAAGQVVVAEGDVVTVNHAEQDAAGQPVAGSERRDFVFEVGTGYNVYEIDDELVGMARGDDKVISKQFPADYRHANLAGRAVTLKVTVTSIKEKRLPSLDDELAQDVSERFATLDDLKADLRARLQRHADRLVRERLAGELISKVLASSQIPLPKTLVAAELEGHWGRLAASAGVEVEQFESALATRGQSKESILEQMRPIVDLRVRTVLLRDELARVEGLEISDEELDAHLAQQAEERGIGAPELRAQYEGENLLDRLRGQLLTDKLDDHLIAGSAVTEGAVIPYVDLVAGNK